MSENNTPASVQSEKYILYRGRPLVREANLICYGDLDEKFMLQLTVMSMKKTKSGADIPDKVLVQILKTDTSLPAHERIEKQDMKNSLFEAFDLGVIWLERMIG